MRVALAGLFVALGVLAVLWAIPEVEASTICHASGNWCQGYAHASTSTGGVASYRCFAVRTTNTAPTTCSSTGLTGPVNEGTWQMDAGACVTFYYFDTTNGVTPPAVPNKVTLDVRGDNTATVIKTFLAAAAEPANGASYTFCATSDGNSGSSARAGTYRVLLNPVKDNGPGGVGNYNINSDGAATVGANIGFDKGALRGKMLVSSLARNAYPAGSMFAYGPAGDETITNTATFTTPNVDANLETMRTGVLDESTLLVGAIGATVDVDSGSLAQNYVVDSTFPFASNPYVLGLDIPGTSALTNTRWTVMATTGHGTNIVYVSDTTVYDSTDIGIDPRIKMDSDTTGGFASADETDRSYVGGTCSGTQIEVFNRGETACTAWGLVNARGEYLSRSMTFARHDATNNVCSSYGSLSPTTNVYSAAGAFNVGGSCAAAATTGGSPRHLRVTNTDQSYDSGTIYSVSSLYFIDAHPQVAGTLSQDNYPTEDATEYFVYLIQEAGGMDTSDTVHTWCHVVGVRKDVNIDTTGSAVTWNIKDPTTATRASGTTDTGSDGWTASSLNLLATTPLGAAWTTLCSVSFNGNTATDTETFQITTAGGGGDMLMADPLKIYGGDEAYAGETVKLAISASYLDGTARTGAAASIFVRVLNPSNTLEVTDATPTEVSHGVYRYTFTPATTGPYVVLARTTDPDSGDPIGTANIVYVRDASAAYSNATDQQILENVTAHRDNSLEVSMLSNFAGLGFDGFLFLLFWVAAILFFLFKDWAFSLAFAIPGLLDALFPDQIPGDFAQYLVFCLLGVVLQYFAGHRVSLRGRRAKTGMES